MNNKKTFLERLKNAGPGLFMTACLIGPGSVTTFGLSGYKYGFALAWTLLFAVVALIIVQSIVRRHIVGGTYRTLISVQNPLRLCRTGICRSLSAG